MSEGSTGAIDEYRIRSAKNWEEAAASWEQKREYTRATFSELTEWLREQAALAPGKTVLELAGGPGDTAVELAPSIVPGGRYIVTDRAGGMVAAQKRSAASAGLNDVIEPRVIDAEKIDLATGTIDAVVCRFGLMLIPDQHAVLSETRRVLRPGGRCAFVVWGPEERNPWATALWNVLDELDDVPVTPPGAPGMFALADREHLAALMSGAGLTVAAMKPVPILWHYPTFENFWETHTSLSGGVARVLPGLSESELGALLDRVRAAVDPYRNADGGYDLPGEALCASGE